jgi:hypothetical protein
MTLVLWINSAKAPTTNRVGSDDFSPLDQ